MPATAGIHGLPGMSAPARTTAPPPEHDAAASVIVPRCRRLSSWTRPGAYRLCCGDADGACRPPVSGRGQAALAGARGIVEPRLADDRLMDALAFAKTKVDKERKGGRRGRKRKLTQQKMWGWEGKKSRHGYARQLRAPCTALRATTPAQRGEGCIYAAHHTQSDGPSREALGRKGDPPSEDGRATIRSAQQAAAGFTSIHDATGARVHSVRGKVAAGAAGARGDSWCRRQNSSRSPPRAAS